MDWGAPIGLGKAGNNPYQLARLGGGLAGIQQGGGLVGMLSNFLAPGNDPEMTNQFAQAAEARGGPVTELPRVPRGLLPYLLQKVGIINPMEQATPHTMDVEKLALEQHQQQHVEEMLKNAGALSSIAKYMGPGAASQFYNNLPEGTFPTGLNFADWHDPELMKMQEQDKKLQAAQAAQTEREHEFDVRQANFEDKFDLAQRHESAYEAGQAAREAREDHFQEQQKRMIFQSMINRYATDARNLIGGPDVQLANQKVASSLQKMMVGGWDPEQALEYLRQDKSLAPAFPDIAVAPTNTDDSGWGIPGEGLLRWALGGTPSYGGAGPASASPGVGSSGAKFVKPKLTK